mmetsp:Transcript_50850/g.80604  ORF Transcript_50850/g.80604 Transcript_50850/m.80604 type:complete len:266 (+) Transcript_50850:197-994(+)
MSNSFQKSSSSFEALAAGAFFAVAPFAFGIAPIDVAGAAFFEVGSLTDAVGALSSKSSQKLSSSSHAPDGALLSSRFNELAPVLDLGFDVFPKLMPAPEDVGGFSGDGAGDDIASTAPLLLAVVISPALGFDDMDPIIFWLMTDPTVLKAQDPHVPFAALPPAASGACPLEGSSCCAARRSSTCVRKCFCSPDRTSKAVSETVGSGSTRRKQTSGSKRFASSSMLNKAQVANNVCSEADRQGPKESFMPACRACISVCAAHAFGI